MIFGGNLSWWEKQDPPYEIRNSELGTTIIDYRRDDGGPFVTHGKLDEIDAFEVFLKKNKNSPWVGKVRTKLEALREEE